MTDSPANPTPVSGGHETVEVVVNRTQVHLETRKVSGVEFKEAAIAQGAELQLDFQLWRIDADGKRHQIADDQEIELHDGERFAANAPDDNS
ncbi:MAG TPA: hypothetical protein VMV53_12080 [Acidimicrobiales bacterium]|nr:hypothetical protein [Acidimicrobiales bacterium]